VQWFFKEEIRSHGWYTAALRKAAVLTRRKILHENSPGFLMKVADELFHGNILEEKIFAVFLLEKTAARLSAKEHPGSHLQLEAPSRHGHDDHCGNTTVRESD
jgi:hypothetical protein